MIDPTFAYLECVGILINIERPEAGPVQSSNSLEDTTHVFAGYVPSSHHQSCSNQYLPSFHVKNIFLSGILSKFIIYINFHFNHHNLDKNNEIMYGVG